MGNAVLLVHPDVDLASWRLRLFDVGGAVAIAGMAAMVLVITARHTRALYQEEKLP